LSRFLQGKKRAKSKRRLAHRYAQFWSAQILVPANVKQTSKRKKQPQKCAMFMKESVQSAVPVDKKR
jgi:hypothetical protein